MNKIEASLYNSLFDMPNKYSSTTGVQGKPQRYHDVWLVEQRMAKLYDWLIFAYVYLQRGSNTSDKNINIRNDALTTADKCHDRLE